MDDEMRAELQAAADRVPGLLKAVEKAGYAPGDPDTTLVLLVAALGIYRLNGLPRSALFALVQTAWDGMELEGSGDA